MPEGDSVYQLARRLQWLTGRIILRSDLRVPAFATVDFRGRRVEAVWPYGKHLFIQCGEDILHTHLAMEGRWDVHRRGERWRRPGHTARVVLEIEGNTGEEVIELVGYQLARVDVFPARSYYEKIGYLGPDILAPDWQEGGREEAIARILASPGIPIGVALLDQRMVAGIGNEYRAEVCFICGVHPARLVGELGEQAVADILDCAHRIMMANRDAPLRVTTGVRRAGESTYVFGRNHRPCRRCQTPIVTGWLGPRTSGDNQDRVIWWCPHCQPAPDAAAPDAAAPSTPPSPEGRGSSEGE